MPRYKVLLRKIEYLMANYTADCHQVTLRDGTRHWLSFHQVMKGCSDSIQGVHSFESYVMGNAQSSSSEWAAKALDMLHVCWSKPEGVQ